MRIGSPSGDGPYLQQVMKPRDDGSPAFPHRLKASSDAPPAVSVLRKELADLRDGSAVLVAIGPLTNIRDLLISAPISTVDLMAGRSSPPRFGRLS